MTTSMTRMEMEDMLSSIRRLVSDRKPENPQNSADVNGVLMLTPALRVETSDPPSAATADSGNLLAGGPELIATPEIDRGAEPQPVADPEPADDEMAQAGQGAEAPSLESRIAELERAVVGSDEQWEPDGSEPGAEHQPELHLLEKYRERFTSLRLSDVGPVGDDESHPGGTEPNEKPAPQAEPSAVEPDFIAAPAMDSGHEAAAAQTASGPELIVAPEDDPGAEAQPVADAGPAGRDDADEVPRVGGDAPLQLADVAIFSHTPRPNGSVPPLGPADAYAPTPPPVPAAPGRGDIIDPDEELLVDEELLRQVVSDIVQDELQGRLGERITRNVRRMVRQEIKRALAVKSLK